MSPRQRRAYLARVQEIANERATLFRRARRVKSGASKGTLLTGHELIVADTPRKRTNALALGARPVLNNAEWREVYLEARAT